MAKYLVKAGFELAGSKERKKELETELKKDLFDEEDKIYVVYDNTVNSLEVVFISL